jgi:membrane associated rhomboid family serine protease
MPRNEPAGALSQVISWLAVLWGIELVDHLLTPMLVPGAHLGQDGALDYLFGLHPWNHAAPLGSQVLWAAIGTVGAPLLHAGWGHLIANSLALAMLGLLSLRYSARLTYVAITYAALISAGLTWLIAPAIDAAGNPIVHVGVSGIIFGLVGFLIANGIVRRGCLPLLIALGVFFLYGGALVGMLPQAAGPNISWQMHLGGFVGGLCASWHLRNDKA